MIFAFTRFWRLLSKEQRVNLSVQKYYIIVPCEDVIEQSIKFKRKIYRHTSEKTINRRWYKERPAFQNHKKKNPCQINKFFEIKTVYIIFKMGSKEWWIYTHRNAQILPFSPQKSVIKDNLQQHRLQMYNCTKTESKRHYKFSYISKACQNTTTRRHFFLNSTIIIITLNTCTYTTCILQLFRSKTKPLI